MLSIIEKIEEYKDSEAVDYLESALEDLRREDQEHFLTIHCLVQAAVSLEVARSNLLSALSHSTPVEAVLIQQMLGRLSETDKLVNQTKSAMEATE
jgi:hypothetical protein